MSRYEEGMRTLEALAERPSALVGRGTLISPA